MKSTTNYPPSSPQPDAGPDKPSRAAEYIAALYVVLVLLTPWLLARCAALRAVEGRRNPDELQGRARAEP